MNKKQLLHSLHEVYCRLGVTKNGVGVIAIRSIPKGTDPFKNCDPYGTVVKISQKELDAYDAPEEAKAIVRDFCALQKGYYHVPSFGIDAMDKSYYLNHSKKPNLIAKKKGEEFVAARDIEAGEELTADYDLYHYTGHFRRK